MVGDPIDWGSHEYACRVVDAAGACLTVEWEDGERDTFRLPNSPRGLIKLPADHPLGAIKKND